MFSGPSAASEPVHGLVLAIVRAGDGLAVALSDGRALAQLAQLPLGDTALLRLRRRALALRDGAAAEGSETATPEEVGRSLGEALGPTLLDALATCRARQLRLQLDDALLSLPWELMPVGAQTLGTRFAVARQVTGSGPYLSIVPADAEALGRRALKVLRVVETAAWPAPQRADTPELQIQEVRSADLDRGRLLEALQSHDVIHVMLPLRAEGGGPGWWQGPGAWTTNDIASLRHPPALVVVQATDPGSADPAAFELAMRSLVRQLYRTGLNLLWLAGAEGDEGAAGLCTRLYTGLAQGLDLGEALRQPRGDASVPTRSTLAFYGDASCCPRPSARRRGGDTDHLRQVTVLSYDLRDSTRLLSSLGVERYSEVLARYHATCTRIITGHGGVSDDPQGDGNMGFFGFPEADEEAAPQAVRTGLALVEAVERLGLSLRVGIATGQVAVRAGRPVGFTAHLAARLQSVAEPGTVWMAESTRELLRGRFETAPVLPLPTLKGIETPVSVFRVLGEARPSSPRSKLAAGQAAHSFVGRQAELAELEAHWTAVCAGETRAVLINGEPGIGKSRLVTEFRQGLQRRQQRISVCRCSPAHTLNAFHAINAMIWRGLGLEAIETPEARLERVREMLAWDPEGEQSVPLFACLLGLASPADVGLSHWTAERLRQRTLDALAAWFRHVTLAGPQCVLVEDYHWIDPSTNELMQRWVQDIRGAPVLLIVTQRDQATRERLPMLHWHRLELKGLEDAASVDLVRQVPGAESLPPAWIEHLGARGDGVPLFIEESTRMALEVWRESPPTFSPATVPASLIPGTLKDLLAARLDRLGPARVLAQVASTLGREFAYPLLAAVVNQDESRAVGNDLDPVLDRLVASGLLIESGPRPRSELHFKHALVRDAAYYSLWERDRRRLHGVAARVMTQRFPELAERHPEGVAQHCALAGEPETAVRHWERAARLAMARSAQVEAIGHLRSALDTLAALPEGSERDRTELRLRTLLAARQIVTQGYGAENVEPTYARALALSESLGDDAMRVKILLGLEAYHFMRARFDRARDLAAQAVDLGTRAGQSALVLQARWVAAKTRFHQGRVLDAMADIDACLDELLGFPSSSVAMQDPGVMCLCYLAWGLWEMGEADRALERAHEAVERARRLAHPFSLSQAYGFQTTIHFFRGEYEEGRRVADRAIEIAEEGGFAIWLTHARLMRGRLRAELGDAAAGMAEMRSAYENWAGTGSVVTRPFYLAMQAEGLALMGRPDGGLALLDLALELIGRHGDRYYEPEVLRLRGELMLQSAQAQGQPQDDAVRQRYLDALHAAETLSMRGLGLRAAMSLARLELSQGRAHAAREWLEPRLRQLGQGRGTRDLRQAEVLLDALR